MTGVEILSSETIYEIEHFWWLIPLFAGIGLLIGLILVIIDWIDCGFDAECIIGIFALTAVFALAGVVGSFISEHKTDVIDYIEYKVTIDDSVPLNEFLDKYEILDQEGKIYTVKERE